MLGSEATGVAPDQEMEVKEGEVKRAGRSFGREDGAPVTDRDLLLFVGDHLDIRGVRFRIVAVQRKLLVLRQDGVGTAPWIPTAWDSFPPSSREHAEQQWVAAEFGIGEEFDIKGCRRVAAAFRVGAEFDIKGCRYRIKDTAFRTLRLVPIRPEPKVHE